MLEKNNSTAHYMDKRISGQLFAILLCFEEVFGLHLSDGINLILYIDYVPRATSDLKF